MECTFKLGGTDDHCLCMNCVKRRGHAADLAEIERRRDLSELMTATDVGDNAFAVIAEAVANKNVRDAAEIGMTAATIVVINTTYCVHHDTGRSPREIITTILHAALEAFPEEAPPKVDDIPTTKRDVKPGPSPWGNVR